MTDLNHLHHAIRACAAKHGITHPQLAEAVIAHRKRLLRLQYEAMIKRNLKALRRAGQTAKQFSKAAERLKNLGVSLERMNKISRESRSTFQ